MRIHLLPFLFVCTFALQAQTDRLYRFYSSSEYTVEQSLLGLQDMSLHRSIHELLPLYDASAEWEEVTIPVVFHVLYTDESDRVTEAQIEEQLDALNSDFAGLTEPAEGDRRDPEGNFAAVKADTKIRFCVPEPGLLDNLLSLVDFRQLTAPLTEDLNLLKGEEFGLPALDTRRYLNVWVAPLPEGNAGFAQLPSGNGETDGIVVDPRYFGQSGTATAPYNEGKTLTHLIGTYLGLTPIWGDGPCGDDGISDTPPHNGPNFGSPGPGHVSMCSGNPLEMTMNFMDAADDAALHMFTKEQGAWMRAVLSEEGPRGELTATLTSCDEGGLFLNSPAVASKTVVEEKLQVDVFPNPTSNILTFRAKGASDQTWMTSIKVYELSGRTIHERTVGKGALSVDVIVSDWTPGIYLVKVKVANGEDSVHRVVIQ